MLGTFGILNFGIRICLGFRAWNFVFEAELCSGGVYPRLTSGDDAGGGKTHPYDFWGDRFKSTGVTGIASLSWKV